MKKLLLFLGLTERERKGFLVLLVLMFLIVLTPAVYRLLWNRGHLPPPELSWKDRAAPEVRSKYAALEARESSSWHKQSDKLEGATIVLQPFDPNGLPAERWQAMGFSAKQIGVIKNYEAKGGRFYDAADVRKIYSISDRDFKRIEPYLRFKDRKEAKWTAREYAPTPQKTSAAIDVNTADTSALMDLYGIGPVLSARIIKFRERLGGFHHVEQLAEVYGLSPEVFSSIMPRLQLNNAAVKQIAINTATEEQLAAHPYCSRKYAQLIVRYRAQHGNFQSIADLRNIYALDANFLLKIEPYLKLN